jgi:hypothetical protein
MDEDNIFQSLGPDGIGQLPANFNQQLAGVAGSQAPSVAAPRQRRSLFDIIGHVADTLATVGGAPAQYQPNVDAALARTQAAEDRPRQIDLDNMRRDLLKTQIAHGNAQTVEDQGKADTAHVALLGVGAKGLRAVFGKSGVDGITRAWPLLAQNLHLSPQETQLISDHLAQDPEGTISALEATAAKAGGSEYGLNPVYTRDAQGNLHLHFPSKSGELNTPDLPAGETPIDPIKVIDTGDGQVVVGSKTGTPQSRFAKAGGPEKGERPVVDPKGNVIRYAPVAGSDLEYKRTHPTAAAGAKTAATQAEQVNGARDALIVLRDISSGFDDLHGMGALPGDPNDPVNTVTGALGRTRVGQAVGEQFGSAAAQKRLEIQKNMANLQQTLIRALPASATRTRFEQEILKTALPDPSKMSYSTARTLIGQYRQKFIRALQDAQRETAGGAAPAPAAKPAARRTTPQRTVRSPSISNW